MSCTTQPAFTAGGCAGAAAAAAGARGVGWAWGGRVGSGAAPHDTSVTAAAKASKRMRMDSPRPYDNPPAPCPEQNSRVPGAMSDFSRDQTESEQEILRLDRRMRRSLIVCGMLAVTL